MKWMTLSDIDPTLLGYEVSDAGTFRSYRRPGSGQLESEPHDVRVQPPVPRRSYPVVGLAGRPHQAHRLVALAHVPRIPPDLKRVDFKNGDRADIRASNLEWVSGATLILRVKARAAGVPYWFMKKHHGLIFSLLVNEWHRYRRDAKGPLDPNPGDEFNEDELLGVKAP